MAKRAGQVVMDVQVAALSAAAIGRLTAAAQATLRRFKAADAVVSVAIVGDAVMRRVHYAFLKKRSATDVVSFDLTDAFEKQRIFQIAVNADRAARQARKRGHSAEAELALYLVHGLLHNLGFDDGSPAQAERMHRTEDAILNGLGYGSVFFGARQKIKVKQQQTARKE